MGDTVCLGIPKDYEPGMNVRDWERAGQTPDIAEAPLPPTKTTDPEANLIMGGLRRLKSLLR